MSESKLRADEINNIKARAQMEMQQRSLIAQFAKTPAVFVNGVFLASMGPMAKLILLETSSPGNPSEVRFVAMMHPADLEQFANGCLNLVKMMKDNPPPAPPEGAQAQPVAADIQELDSLDEDGQKINVDEIAAT